MAICTGKRRSAATCQDIVYSCAECTNVGCDQINGGECSNQGFRLGICLSCGTRRARKELGRLVITPQLREAFRVLRLPLPED
jgi:hypothetical protein